MNFTELLIFILASIGLTNIIINGSIFETIREFIQSKSEFLGELLSCPTCIGMWIGILLSLFYFNLPWLVAGSIASVSNYVFALVMDYLSIQTYSVLHHEHEGEEDNEE